MGDSLERSRRVAVTGEKLLLADLLKNLVAAQQLAHGRAGAADGEGDALVAERRDRLLKGVGAGGVCV